MFLRLLSSLICNAQKLIKKYYGYNIKLIKKNKKKSNNILTDTDFCRLFLKNDVQLVCGNISTIIIQRCVE